MQYDSLLIVSKEERDETIINKNVKNRRVESTVSRQKKGSIQS
jgi:hypothetical protein